MQRPMPSPEKAIGAVRAAAAAAAVLALERNSAERNPSKRDRGGGLDLITDRRMRMQWEWHVVEEERRKQTRGQAV